MSNQERVAELILSSGERLQIGPGVDLARLKQVLAHCASRDDPSGGQRSRLLGNGAMRNERFFFLMT